MTRRLIILGSTGSIGTQALAVVEHLNALHERGVFPHRTRVVGIAAGTRRDELEHQAQRWGGCATALAEPGPPGPTFQGPDAALRLVREIECDVVLAAMVGSAGLPATLEAARLGRDVALANKETLVAAGGLVVAAARASGSRLLPVDSEHAGLWRCLDAAGELAPPWPPDRAPRAVRRLILTASGGPFRAWTARRIAEATPADALNHPTWSMGPKVTVDSASLMNKALELIEAHWLFGLPPDRLDALVHPQSIVHALVEWDDGSILAQLSPTDMRHPIQQALAWPHRVAPAAAPLDLARLRTLEFEPPDPERFPAITSARRVLLAGGCAGAILNAANEAAVQRFLASAGSARPMAFGLIWRAVDATLDALDAPPAPDLAAVLDADRRARAYADAEIDRLLREPAPPARVP